jgi:hypothetical protein
MKTIALYCLIGTSLGIGVCMIATHAALKVLDGQGHQGLFILGHILLVFGVFMTARLEGKGRGPR